MQGEITSVYSKLAKEKGAEIVPVGTAWQIARKVRPDASLYIADGSHPSPLGTFLSACIWKIMI